MRRALFTLPLLGLSCSMSPIAEGDAVSTSTDLTASSRAKAIAYADDAAVSWVSKDDWAFVQGGRCVMSCHTTVPFMMLAAHTPAADAGPSAVTTVRGYVEARVNGWSTIAPLYSWVPEESRGLEAIVNAFALVASDRPAGALSSVAETALANMWAEQNADGSFPWWTSFTLAPWENPDAGVWGAALADYAVGLAPSTYVSGMTPAETTKLGLLESYLQTKASSSAVPLHNRAMILVAASMRTALLDAATKTTIADAIRALQGTNGAWPADSLGFVPQGGAAAATGDHAYATAYYTFVLAQNGEALDAQRVADGRAWLDANQRADGAWAAKSLNVPADPFNNQLITEAATIYALLANAP